jgi:hypothetical protein
MNIEMDFTSLSLYILHSIRYVQCVTMCGAKRYSSGGTGSYYLCKMELCNMMFYIKVLNCEHCFWNYVNKHKYRTKENEMVMLSLIT